MIHEKADKRMRESMEKKAEENDTRSHELRIKAEKRLHDQPQANDPNQSVSVQDLQGTPKPQPRFKRQRNIEQAQ